MPANGESGQSTSILGGSPSSCRMEMTTSCGTPPAGSDRNPEVAGPWSSTTVPNDPDAFRPGGVHVGLVLGAPGRAKRAWAAAASCGLSYHHRFRPAGITHTVRTAPRKGTACGAGPSGRSSEQIHGSPGPSTALELRSGTTTNVSWRLARYSPMLRNDAGILRAGAIPSEVGHERSESSPDRLRRGGRAP